MADLGQVFTRQVVAKYMTSLFDLPKEATVLDPCFGAGAFLEALESYEFKNVTGCEVETALYEMQKSKFKEYQLLNQDFLQFESSEGFDGIIMNPPYIRQEKIDDLKYLGITKKKLRQNIIFNNLPSNANMYMYFILKAMDLLKTNGQLVVIFPSSWLNAKSGHQFKKALLNTGRIEKVIYLHGDVFEKEALVDVVILKVVKTTAVLDTIEEYLEVLGENIEPMLLKKESMRTVFECPFDKLASIQRGLTTGCNQLFINPDIKSSDAHFKEIISSPKSLIGYSTDNAKLDQLLDCTGGDLSEHAKCYLDTWKKKILIDGKPKTLLTKIQNGQNWYVVRTVPSRGIIFSYFVRNDMKFILNDSDMLVRDNFYIIRPYGDKLLMMALLNNYYTFYQLENFGKKYGAGLLKLQRYDLERLRFPCVDQMSNDDIIKLKNLAQRLVVSGNSDLIEEITKVLSAYSAVDSETIEKEYREIKKQRLEGIKNEN